MPAFRPHVALVLAYDAGPLLTKLEFQGLLRPGQRFQKISVEDVLEPTEPGLCRCGCGRPIVPPARKWHLPRCVFFADAVAEIIRGNPRVITRYLGYRHGRQCAACGTPEGLTTLEVDHIRPVANGGGGRWLDNYQLLCPRCHKAKTAAQLRAAVDRKEADSHT